MPLTETDLIIIISPKKVFLKYIQILSMLSKTNLVCDTSTLSCIAKFEGKSTELIIINEYF